MNGCRRAYFFCCWFLSVSCFFSVILSVRNFVDFCLHIKQSRDKIRQKLSSSFFPTFGFSVCLPASSVIHSFIMSASSATATATATTLPKPFVPDIAAEDLLYRVDDGVCDVDAVLLNKYHMTVAQFLEKMEKQSDVFLPGNDRRAELQAYLTQHFPTKLRYVNQFLGIVQVRLSKAVRKSLATYLECTSWYEMAWEVLSDGYAHQPDIATWATALVMVSVLHNWIADYWKQLTPQERRQYLQQRALVRLCKDTVNKRAFVLTRQGSSVGGGRKNNRGASSSSTLSASASSALSSSTLSASASSAPSSFRAPEEATSFAWNKLEDFTQAHCLTLETQFARDGGALATQFELEVRVDARQLQRSHYDSIFQALRAQGWTWCEEPVYLNLGHKYANREGTLTHSHVRASLHGPEVIRQFGSHGKLEPLRHHAGLVLTSKRKPANEVRHLDIPDFPLRVSWKEERILDKLQDQTAQSILRGWSQLPTKHFRCIKRVVLTPPSSSDTPWIRVHMSIVRQMTDPKQVEDVFKQAEQYEVEMEVHNESLLAALATQRAVRPSVPVAVQLAAQLRKVIRVVLSGLQKSAYPIGFREQEGVIDEYMSLIYGRDWRHHIHQVTSRHFAGPQPVTLLREHLALPSSSPLSTSSASTSSASVAAAAAAAPSGAAALEEYCVTDKADGDRCLLFISSEGRVYGIDTAMQVWFTGTRTLRKECFRSLLDGEHILHTKHDVYWNAWLAFDVYYLEGKDLRALPFWRSGSSDRCRYQEMAQCVGQLQLQHVSDPARPCPLLARCKVFHAVEDCGSIFEANRLTLREGEGYEYNVDGLIFTPCHLGVGASQEDMAGPKWKITWDRAFKWKPPQWNTVDFLVRTVKDPQSCRDTEFLVDDPGNALVKYKQLELMCGYHEGSDGWMDPFAVMLQRRYDSVGNQNGTGSGGDYRPMRFCPVEPYAPENGWTNVALTPDGWMVAEEGDPFQDNMIVEFRYDAEREGGWRWVPLRVRHDKTMRLRRGEKEFGNAFRVCNDTWKTIAFPLTEEMLTTGRGLDSLPEQEDMYYHTRGAREAFHTERLKLFHNIFVKRKLLLATCQPNDLLIDLACGKAGDLPKWTQARAAFVLGLDLSSDNIHNAVDGACARYVNLRRRHQLGAREKVSSSSSSLSKSSSTVPKALFLQADCTRNIWEGDAFLQAQDRRIAAAVLGQTQQSDAEELGKGVADCWSLGQYGFHVASCQFALHYFFRDLTTLQGFLANVAMCTKEQGYFVATAFDGQKVFEVLRRQKEMVLHVDHKLLFSLEKKYLADEFVGDSSSLGYEIRVFQESIGQFVSEYLVHHEFLCRAMENYGFQLITDEEAADIGMPKASACFHELFECMAREASPLYAKALQMSAAEQTISFLNRYWIFRKRQHVVPSHVVLEHVPSGAMSVTTDTGSNTTAATVAQSAEKKKEKGEQKEKAPKEKKNSKEEGKEKAPKQKAQKRGNTSPSAPPKKPRKKTETK